ncbi:MAG: PGF-pre-PGF domain-containing protein, partial [Candidatus Methanoperedens sp.]|nr:PGF-pre-PGF domain-containing protein [Candidatus Methanoperedens sp.]
TLVKDDAPGEVYKYVNIWVGTSGFAVPENIKEAVIKFKLENSWITSKGFKESDIAMLRWDGTQWTSLATEKKNSDGNFTYYEAKTNAFSPFAISGVKGVVSAAAVE